MHVTRNALALFIKGNEVVDTFVSEQDALRAGYEKLGNVPFLVKQVTEFDSPVNFTSFLVSAAPG